MGNNFKTCCSDTKDVTNELNRMEKEVDETVERSKANAKTYNAAPYIEKKSLEIFENPEISAIKNHLSDTPHDIKNIKALSGVLQDFTTQPTSSVILSISIGREFTLESASIHIIGSLNFSKQSKIN